MVHLQVSQAVILLKTLPARVDHSFGRLGRLLGKDIEDHYRVRIRTIDDSPGLAFVVHPELMASRANRRHRPRVGQGQKLALLKQPQEESGFQPGLFREWRRSNFAMQPNQRLVVWAHKLKVYVIFDIMARENWCAEYARVCPDFPADEGCSSKRERLPSRGHIAGPKWACLASFAL